MKKHINFFIIFWTIILILFIINLFKQILVPRITKEVTPLIITLVIIILGNELEIGYLHSRLANQEKLLNDIWEYAKQNKKGTNKT